MVPSVSISGGATNRTNLRVHFFQCHVQYAIVILEEVIRYYPH